MGKKRRLKKQKLAASKRRMPQVAGYQSAVTIESEGEPAPKTIYHTQRNSIYNYPINLVKKDLIKSLILSVGAIIILLSLKIYYQ